LGSVIGSRHIWRQRLLSRLIRPVHRHYPGRSGTNLLDRDWDNLFILDACRVDLFEEATNRDSFDQYGTVTSLGSHTGEWGRATFTGRAYGDTVYVTANPYASRTAAESVHAIREVWHDAFDESLRTVLPEAVVSAARQAHEDYPDKRLVVHFMQPHHPFVRDEELREFSNWDIEKADDEDATIERPHDPFDALEMGLVSRERLWEAYLDNLELVLEHVWQLSDELGGRTVITSDHGNLLGERAWPVPVRLYGHPRGVRSKPLVTVPYAVIDGTRREVTSGGVGASSAADDATVTERLRMLGYHE
jgi:hypothetical protein